MESNGNDSSSHIISLFNSPIGYFKNPIVHEKNREKNRDRDTKLSSSNNTINSLTYKSPLSKGNGLTLDKLPFELRVKIANELSQYDCINLLRVCKSLYISTIVRLDQHIQVDKNFSQFSKEFDYHQYMDTEFGIQPFSCSFIKTSYNYKKFLISYTKLFKQVTTNDHFLDLNLENFPYVKALYFIDIPDALNIHDHNLTDTLDQFFTTLVNLKCFIWLDNGFKLDYLWNIPKSSLITSLSLNIRNNSQLSEFRSNTTNRSILSSSPKDLYNYQSLSMLESLYIIPFQTSNQLTKLLTKILKFNQNLSQNLKILKLAKFDHEITLLIYPYYSLVSNSTNQIKPQDSNTLRAIFIDCNMFQNHTILQNLSILQLSGCILNANEADLLCKSVNLENLQTLELKQISEYQLIDSFIDTPQPEDLEPSFLDRICPLLKNLNHLHLDYREALVDTVPRFLERLPTRNLQSLDLVIRYNTSKLQSFNQDANLLYEEYSNSIISGNNSKTLKKLAIDIKEENVFCDLTIPIPSNHFYNEIAQCKQLTSLRINPSTKTEDGSHQKGHIISIVSQLNKLKYLEVFGTQAGGAPHMGLEMVHPTIFDEWFKVQHVAMLYSQTNSNIQYIKINKCLFESISGDMNPRDGIDRWFNHKVRVGVD